MKTQTKKNFNNSKQNYITTIHHYFTQMHHLSSPTLCELHHSIKTNKKPSPTSIRKDSISTYTYHFKTKQQLLLHYQIKTLYFLKIYIFHNKRFLAVLQQQVHNHSFPKKSSNNNERQQTFQCHLNKIYNNQEITKPQNKTRLLTQR